MPQESSSPPRTYWLIPLVLSMLRMLPFWRIRWTSPPEGEAWLGLGYLPRDFLAYRSFIRQAIDAPPPFHLNLFTTEPQEPRFLLLFHEILGWIGRLTGATPEALLEWSRVPLIFLLFFLAWRLSGRFFESRQERVWFAVLLGFAGGLESLVRLWANVLPPEWAPSLLGSTWQLQGWSTFAASYNPLWLAAFCLAFALIERLMHVLKQGGTWGWIQIALLWGTLFFTHPYSALHVLVFLGVFLAWTGLRQGKLTKPSAGMALSCLGTVLCGAGLITFWQRAEPVFLAASGGVFGRQPMSLFWYPITLGVLGVFAVLGALNWKRESHPALPCVLIWLGSATVLHANPWMIGYKFVMCLHAPLCILATPALVRWLAPNPQGKPPRSGLVWIPVLLLFVNPLPMTLESFREAPEINRVPADNFRVVEALRDKPVGPVLPTPDLGNMLPAYLPHPVWYGHWFLTPDYTRRAAVYAALISEPSLADEFPQFVQSRGLKYLVIPKDREPLVSSALDGLILERETLGSLELLSLRSEPVTP